MVRRKMSFFAGKGEFAALLLVNAFQSNRIAFE
jgi:hypothetical protein